MQGIDDIYDIINDGKKLEEKGLNLSAYRAYLCAEKVVEEDDDSYAFAGLNIEPFEKAQRYANSFRRKVWWKLTEDEKKVANNDYKDYWKDLELL